MSKDGQLIYPASRRRTRRFFRRASFAAAAACAVAAGAKFSLVADNLSGISGSAAGVSSGEGWSFLATSVFVVVCAGSALAGWLLTRTVGWWVQMRIAQKQRIVEQRQAVEAQAALAAAGWSYPASPAAVDVPAETTLRPRRRRHVSGLAEEAFEAEQSVRVPVEPKRRSRAGVVPEPPAHPPAGPPPRRASAVSNESTAPVALGEPSPPIDPPRAVRARHRRVPVEPGSSAAPADRSGHAGVVGTVSVSGAGDTDAAPGNGANGAGNVRGAAGDGADGAGIGVAGGNGSPSDGGNGEAPGVTPERRPRTARKRDGAGPRRRRGGRRGRTGSAARDPSEPAPG